MTFKYIADALCAVASVFCVIFWAGYIIVDLMKPISIEGLVCHSIMLAAAIWAMMYLTRRAGGD